ELLGGLIHEYRLAAESLIAQLVQSTRSVPSTPRPNPSRDQGSRSECPHGVLPGCDPPRKPAHPPEPNNRAPHAAQPYVHLLVSRARVPDRAGLSNRFADRGALDSHRPPRITGLPGETEYSAPTGTAGSRMSWSGWESSRQGARSGRSSRRPGLSHRRG